MNQTQKSYINISLDVFIDPNMWRIMDIVMKKFIDFAYKSISKEENRRNTIEAFYLSDKVYREIQNGFLQNMYNIFIAQNISEFRLDGIPVLRALDGTNHGYDFTYKTKVNFVKIARPQLLDSIELLIVEHFLKSGRTPNFNGMGVVVSSFPDKLLRKIEDLTKPKDYRYLDLVSNDAYPMIRI